MTLAKRLTILKQHGWTCEHPDFRHTVGKTEPMSCVYLTGKMADVEREAWMCVSTGLVMLHAGQDFAFDDFISELESPASVEPEVCGKRQGELF